MFKEHLQKLFAAYDPQLQMLITRTLVFEQQNISLERVHFKQQLDEIITQVAALGEARREPDRGGGES